MRGSVIAAAAIAGLAFGQALAQDVPTSVPRPKVTVPAGATLPAATGPAAARAAAEGHGQVFLLRGLVNVFSLGMDTLGRKIRARDIPVRVTNFTNWRGYAAVLVDLFPSDKSLVPVVIMGHSLGADAALDMGNFLAGNGVPVRLVVAFDGVHGGHVVAPGVEEVINYYKADGVGQLVKAAPGFKGKLTNVDLSDRTEIDHLNIEKSSALHAEVIAKLATIFAVADD